MLIYINPSTLVSSHIRTSNIKNRPCYYDLKKKKKKKPHVINNLKNFGIFEMFRIDHGILKN